MYICIYIYILLPSFRKSWLLDNCSERKEGHIVDHDDYHDHYANKYGEYRYIYMYIFLL